MTPDDGIELSIGQALRQAAVINHTAVRYGSPVSLRARTLRDLLGTLGSIMVLGHADFVATVLDDEFVAKQYADGSFHLEFPNVYVADVVDDGAQ